MSVPFAFAIDRRAPLAPTRCPSAAARPSTRSPRAAGSAQARPCVCCCHYYYYYFHHYYYTYYYSVYCCCCYYYYYYYYYNLPLLVPPFFT